MKMSLDMISVLVQVGAVKHGDPRIKSEEVESGKSQEDGGSRGRISKAGGVSHDSDSDYD